MNHNFIRSGFRKACEGAVLFQDPSLYIKKNGVEIFNRDFLAKKGYHVLMEPPLDVLCSITETPQKDGHYVRIFFGQTNWSQPHDFVANVQLITNGTFLTNFSKELVIQLDALLQEQKVNAFVDGLQLHGFSLGAVLALKMRKVLDEAFRTMKFYSIYQSRVRLYKVPTFSFGVAPYKASKEKVEKDSNSFALISFSDPLHYTQMLGCGACKHYDTRNLYQTFRNTFTNINWFDRLILDSWLGKLLLTSRDVKQHDPKVYLKSL